MRVTLYSREDCHLCHQVQADLEALQPEYPHLLVVIDIDSSPILQRQYGEQIPVIEIGSLIMKAPITQAELRKALAMASAQDRPRDDPATDVIGQPINNRVASAATPKQINTGDRWTRSDSFTYWFSRHYLAVLNFIVALFVALPFVAPILLKAGYQAPAAVIYRIYGATCHQLSYRSFFLFGEQPVYPRSAAGVVGLLTFQQATGIDEGNSASDIIAARIFTGNPAIGYKVAICERDIAIYGAILLFGLLYALTGRRIPALPWYLWLLIGLVPIGLDGFSQLFSQPPFNFIPYRESSPFLRVFTGFLFGFTTAWFGYPVIEQSMRDTQEMMEAKRQKTLATTAAAIETEPAD